MGLIDTPHGIRLASCVKKFQMNLINHKLSLSSPPLAPVISMPQDMPSYAASINRRYQKSLPPSPVKSDSSINSTLHRYVVQNGTIPNNKIHYRDSDEANMLLALRYTHTSKP